MEGIRKMNKMETTKKCWKIDFTDYRQRTGDNQWQHGSSTVYYLKANIKKYLGYDTDTLLAEDINTPYDDPPYTSMADMVIHHQIPYRVCYWT